MANKTKGTGANRGSSHGVLVLILSALFVALSIILGKQLSFTAGPFRISFENLTILLAGIFFGPATGAAVGVCADLIGCLLVGYSINPIVTAGAGLFLYYRYPPALLCLRVPLYLVIGTLEGYIIFLLLRNKEITRLLERSTTI